MDAIVSTVSNGLLALPDANITTRVATMDDLPAIDALQKQYHKQLGFFPRAQMEGYIRGGWVRVAEEGVGVWALGVGEEQDEDAAIILPSAPTPNPQLPTPKILGYCASRDRYLKRDELGAIFQLCVAPSAQRKFVGANLLASVFDASPWGCKLYCCWCAQDLAANRFWEAMGFVPLAFRAGSREKSRVHIFWQKRIRDDATPWWFPSTTGGGAIREDRIVLPIPPGTHWSDAKPLIYPEMSGLMLPTTETKQLPAPRERKKKIEPPKLEGMAAGGLRFETTPAAVEKIKPTREKRAKVKADPRVAAASRELRDRWLEQINAVPQIDAGKYALTRQPEQTLTIESRPKQRLLAA